MITQRFFSQKPSRAGLQARGSALPPRIYGTFRGKKSPALSPALSPIMAIDRKRNLRHRVGLYILRSPRLAACVAGRRAPAGRRQLARLLP
jgi:hypothetical protein